MYSKSHIGKLGLKGGLLGVCLKSHIGNLGLRGGLCAHSPTLVRIREDREIISINNIQLVYDLLGGTQKQNHEDSCLK